MKIQIIGNPRNTKQQQVLVGNLDFYTSTVKIETLLAARGHLFLNFIIPGSTNIIIIG